MSSSMVNKLFLKVVKKNTKEWNPSIMQILSTRMLPDVERYLDKICTSAMLSLNRGINLEYIGYKTLTPEEEYNTILGGNVNIGKKKMPYDFGRSDVRMIKLLFNFNQEPIPARNLYIPFVDEETGIMHISDTKYSCIPVLSDTIVSPTSKDIFARLLRDKVTFKREIRNVLFNGRVLSSELIYKDLYRTQNRVIVDNLGKMVTPSPAYLFGKIGFMETFVKYANTKPILIVGEYDKDKYLDYDKYTTKGEKPWSLKNDNYEAHEVKILIHKEKSRDYIVQTLVTGFIYMLDIFPDLAEELVNTIEANDIDTETDYWRILLSKIIFKNSYSVERGLSDINNHFNSLDSYIDPIVKEKLQENELYINTFFDLIAYVCKTFKELTTNHKLISADIRNRYVDILYYILYDCFEALIRTLFELNKKKDRNTVLTAEIIKKAFDFNFSPKKIFNLNSKGSLNIALLHADNVGDNKMKLIQSCELQENGRGVNRATKNKHGAPSSTANPTGSIFGSMYQVTKGSLDEYMKINPFIKLTRTGRIDLTDQQLEYIKTMERLLNSTNTDINAREINRMFETNNIDEDIKMD